jgi:alkylation response protein AidB-like acyl-CoA dehydrogenase
MAQADRDMTPGSTNAIDCAAVDFDLSSDQEALRDAAANLLDGVADQAARRARVGHGVVVGTLPGSGAAGPASAADDAPRGFDGAAWAAMAEQGWLALELPEDEGGLDMGMVEAAVLCEQIGRRLVAAPFLPTFLALGALHHPEARKMGDFSLWRQSLSAGEAVGCVAFVPDPDRLTIGGSGDDRLLSGRTAPTLYAPSADVAIVATPTEVYAVDLHAQGNPPALSAMDRTRELGVLSFEGTPAIQIGEAEAAAMLLDRAATAVSAEMLGAADQVLSMAVGYAKDRVQFGKPIGSFQAVKHMLADALVDVEGMRSTAYYAAWCAAADDRERSLAASMAKSWGTDASRRVMATGLQVHGGIGFTWEHDMHLYHRRALAGEANFGNAPIHRETVAKSLLA